MWPELQKYLQKPNILFSIIVIFSLIQTATTITSESFIQLHDPKINQLLAAEYDCSKQYSLKQFSLNQEQKCTQTPSAIEFTRTFASVYVRAEAKRARVLRCSATIQKTCVSPAQGAHYKKYTHDRIDWHTSTFSLLKKL